MFGIVIKAYRRQQEILYVSQTHGHHIEDTKIHVRMIYSVYYLLHPIHLLIQGSFAVKMYTYLSAFYPLNG